MKYLLLFFLLYTTSISKAQLTYVPDDALESYFETLFIGASNGVINDNYVFTSGLQQPGNSFWWDTSFESLFGTLTDLTGLQDCKYLEFIGFTDVSPAIIDLTTLNNETPFMFSVINCNNLTTINLSSLNGTNTLTQLGAADCNQLNQINLPSCNITDFAVTGCPLITSINFPAGSKIVGPANLGVVNNISLILFDLSNAQIIGGCDLTISDNQNLNCVDLQGGFCNMITPYFSYNPFVYCVQVDNPSYSYSAWQNLSSENWYEQWFYNFNNPGGTNPYIYSTNCNCFNSVVENAVFSQTTISPNPSSFYITVNNSTNESINYSIYDIQGKVQLIGKANYLEKIDISELKNGVYFLNTDKSFPMIKFIVTQN
jgi:hypothetical protein